MTEMQRLDRDALMAVNARGFVFARATKARTVAAYSSGRLVIDNGVVTGVDLPRLENELRAWMRAGLAAKTDVINAWPVIEPAIAAHYQGCC